MLEVPDDMRSSSILFYMIFTFWASWQLFSFRILGRTGYDNFTRRSKSIAIIIDSSPPGILTFSKMLLSMPLRNLTLLLISFLATASDASDVEQFSRTDIGILGIDILHVNTNAAIQKAQASGDLVKVAEGCSNIDDLQWLPWGYFKNNPFY